MADLIDRPMAYNVLTDYYHHNTDVQHIALADALSKVPSVEAEPVRHGRWKTCEGWDGDEYYECSECGDAFTLIDGTPQDNDYLYCPHCGARMDGVRDDINK